MHAVHIYVIGRLFTAISLHNLFSQKLEFLDLQTFITKQWERNTVINYVVVIRNEITAENAIFHHR